MVLSQDEYKEFAQELRAALQPLAEKYNCALTLKGIKYNEVLTEVSLHFKSSEPPSMEKELYLKYARAYGFAEGDYRRPFEFNSRLFYLVGFDIHARKYNCIIEDVETQKRSKASVSDIKAALQI